VDVHAAEFRRIVETLRTVAALFRDAEVRYTLSGSVASWARGGPETVNDLDLVVAPADLDDAVRVLEGAGMRIEVPPEGWLVKAEHSPEGAGDDVVVDLIHTVTGVDDVTEMIDRSEVMRVASLDVPVARVEDVLTPKLLSFDDHYLDYTGALRVVRALREQIDWTLLGERVGRSPYARGFIGLCRELGVAPPPAAGGSASTIRVSTA
jgi:hypothetical protein